MTDTNKNDHAQAFVDGLNKTSVESVARSERYEKVFEIEKKKWHHNMGSMKRDEILEELHKELDACISKSQITAREACQSVELTEKYIKENS